MTDVLAFLPELADIDDPGLRESVRTCWTRACHENGIEDLEAMPWFPPVQRELGIEDETLAAHVRDVVAGALALADSLAETRGTDVDRDLLLAAALVHDVSKLYEFDRPDETPIGDLLGHPYYGVHCVAAVGLPVECAHVVLAHTSRTTVEPAFLEAELVRRADEAAAAAIRLTALEDLRDAEETVLLRDCLPCVWPTARSRATRATTRGDGSSACSARGSSSPASLFTGSRARRTRRAC